MKKFYAVLFCLSLTGILCAAEIKERLSGVLPANVSIELLSRGSVKNTSYRQAGAKTLLNPDITLAKEALSFWTGENAPFFSEALFLYKKPDAKQGVSGSETQKISVILRSLSRLQGIEYYSNSRKKMRTLFEKSYVVDGLSGKKAVADPVQGSADGLSVYAVQKDLTFGEYLYNYTYRQTGDSAAFFSRNIDPMHYSFLKVLDSDKLHISLVVYEMGDYLLVYGLTRADFPAIPGLDNKLNLSFSSRTDAMYAWFIKEYENK